MGLDILKSDSIYGTKTVHTCLKPNMKFNTIHVRSTSHGYRDFLSLLVTLNYAHPTILPGNIKKLLKLPSPLTLPLPAFAPAIVWGLEVRGKLYISQDVMFFGVVTMGIIYTEVSRPKREVIEAFRALPTAVIADAMNRFNVMDSGIKPLFPGAKICGPAITVREMVGCNIMLHKAIQIAEKGDVIVVDAGGYVNRAIGGYILSLAAAVKGVEGIVVDGAWRDLEAMRRERPLPVYARAVTPAGPHKGFGGDINVPIQCGGVPVSPGDIIVGDDDGVVVVPKDIAEEVLKKAKELMEKEKEVIEKVKRGISTVEIYGFDEKLKELGVKIV